MTTTDVQLLFAAISELKVEVGKLQEQLKPSGTALSDHEARIRILESSMLGKAGKLSWTTIASAIIVITSILVVVASFMFHQNG